MAYTDLQLKNATQVAYKDFSAAFTALENAGEKPPYTIEQLCALSVNPNDPKASEDPVAAFFPDLDDRRDEVASWKIVDIYDNNRDKPGATGFYGCVIDIGGGDAIVAFRGSEKATDLSNLQHDWIEADLGLLNNTLTKQQADVYSFLKEIAQSDYIDNYDSLGFTGHSLGGNLAMHAAVISALPEIGLYDKLERCVSYDGPGYSDEYLAQYAPLIEMVNEKITHYKWSPVGGLLFEFPGVQRIPLKYKNSKSFIYNLIGRHSTESVIFDGENAVRGETNLWDFATSKFSQGIEHMPSNIGDALVLTVSGLAYAGIWMYNEMFDDNKLTPFGYVVAAAAIRFVVSFGPLKTVGLVGTILMVVAVVFCAVVIYELVYEAIEYVVNAIVDAVVDVYNWVSDKIQELKEFVANGLKQLKKWLKEKFDKGYKYATENPYVRLDTYKLKNYSQRLNSVNRRIIKLDRRLDSLYWSVGLLDLWNLMQADALTGFSWRLLRCAGYLSDTASDYESVESDLKNNL